MKSGLEELPGAKSVKQTGFRNKKMTFTIVMDAEKPLTVEAVLDAAGFYGVEKLELKITGSVEKTEKGLVFTARGSGLKYELKNRAKKEGEKEAPNIAARIEEQLKAGKKTFLLSGEAKTEKKAQVLLLESAEPVEEKKEEKQEK